MTDPRIKKALQQFRDADEQERADEKAATELLRDEYPDKYAGLKADAIRTQGDTK